MSEIIFIVEESPEGGFEAKALGHSIFTKGDTIEEVKIMLEKPFAAILIEKPLK